MNNTWLYIIILVLLAFSGLRLVNYVVQDAVIERTK